MNQARKRTGTKKVLSMILVLVMLLSLLSMAAFTLPASETGNSKNAYEYNIMFLDCGRKYFSVDSIEKIIDNASAAGFNYIQLAVGNDGLRFLLNDMSLTVNGAMYSTAEVTEAIQNGNMAYNATFKNAVTQDTNVKCPYNPSVNELTQNEMDEIITYAASKGMGVIPCVNTPGHMDAILSAANSLTGTTCSYEGSVRTIDVTNTTAVAFTTALLQKYIDYFAGKGCQLFNMGADEYANDKYPGGAMGFGNLQDTHNYHYYVEYVNEVAAMIKKAGMKPMAFNDGIYFNNNISSGEFDTDIIICYWSNGWPGYTPMPASTLAKDFKLINTNGGYYWVLGKKDKCSEVKASGFNKNSFPGGGKIDNPAGSMFCIWSDYPGAETEESVIKKTADTISAFGKTLPTVNKVETVESKTVTKDNVTVTAPGLTDLTVAAADAPAIDAAAEGKVVAYDVTPATASGSYEKNGIVTLRIPEGWDASRVRGYVVNGDGSVTTGLTGTIADDKFTFTVSHFSKMGLYELAANAVTETRTINLTVGSTKTDTIDGANYENDHTDPDTAIATVTVEGQDEVPSTVKYDPKRVGYKTLAGSNSDWTKTIYFYKVDDNYYPVYAYQSYWTYYYIGYSVTDDSNNIEPIVNGTYYNNNLDVYTKSGTEGTPASTTVSFKGVAVGTTYVIVGNVKYVITVTDEDLDSVTPLTVEYWITNQKVTGSDGAKSKTISAASAYGENGVLFSKLVPATGTQDGKNDVFWKGTRLTSDNKQTEGKGVDKTTSGNDFTYIRYWNQQWSFSADGKSWTDFNSDDQVVAYYLQKTNVTDEIATKVVDWGEPQEKYNGQNYVIVDYAVKYLSGGTRVPNSFPVAGKSIGFHCDSSDTNTVHTDSTGNLYRSIGMIKAEATDNYEVYMITLTPSEALTGSRCSDNTKITYNTTDAAAADNTVKSEEKVVWVDNESDLGEFTDPDTHFTSITGDISYKVGGEPVVPGLEIYNKHGMLVTYYVREKETPDSLHVHYIDTTGSSSNEFYSYAINVHQDTTFDKEIALNNPWKGDLKNGSVTNIANKVQTVSSDLSTMPVIGASYRYSMYTCNEVKRSPDGKDVYLYYTFSNKVSYVVDFGLPLNINLSDLNASLVNAQVTSVNVDGAKYGTTAYADKVVTYTPTKAINEIDTLSVTVTGHITYKDDSGEEVTQDGTVSYLVDIIPATSVYYEDSFAKFAPGTDKASGATWSIVDNDGKVTEDKSTSKNQALTELHKMSPDAVYGYDAAYAVDSTKLSMGSAHKVTVKSDMYKKGDTTTTWPYATFTFKGTGFDVISLTSNTSGTVMYTVKNSSGETKKTGLVDTYYGYTLDGDKWVVDKDSNDSLYQIPVIKVSGLDYDEYTVTLSVRYGDFFDHQGKGEYSFWLDAIRVYDPKGKDDATYTQDGEGYPQYIMLRDQLAEENGPVTTNTNLLFIDGADKATIATYANYGPNNEVYLAKGQAIAFNVPQNANIESIQIGAKAPNGSAATMVVNKNEDDAKVIQSATEMYYEIGTEGKNFTIANKGEGILSLTNLKITFKASGQTVALSPLSTDAQADAVMSVRALFAAPEQTFEPKYFTAKWSRNVRKGGTATLTVKASADVESITVNGETITAYTTKTARSFWGAKETYHVFTYRVTNAATADYSICAVNADGVASDPITAQLTVRPSIRDWWNDIFDKWKH